MQEFTTEMKSITAGLRKAPGQRNAGGLQNCVNLQPWRGKLISFFEVFAPKEFNPDFPFPQLHIGAQYFWLDRYSITLLDNEFYIREVFNITEGGVWHVADFDGYVVFANGSCVVTYDIANGFELNETLPRFSTCCNYNGQLFVGGFYEPWEDASRSFVGWSKIGQAVFALDQSNTSGYANTSINNEVVKVLQLGKSVIAYGTVAHFRFPAVSEPIVGFGKSRIDDIPGLISRDAVAGTASKHLLVDGSGDVWLLEDGKAPADLGYNEFFSSMIGSDVVVTYNEKHKAFDITNGEQSFRFTDYGLCQTRQAIMSQQYIQGGVVGLFDVLEDDGFVLSSEIFNFGFRGLKTVNGVELLGSFSAPVFVSLSWRSHNERFFRTSPWVRANHLGQAFPVVTAEEFILHIQSADYRGVELDKVSVKWQISDKRNLRGSVNVDSDNSGTNS